MTLKQLEAFYWAASTPSFAAAAQRLHLTVSSLSKRLGELEASLGQPLFDRSGHRAVLTPQGERLLPLAVDLLQRAGAVRQIVGDRQGLHGSCRIGAGELASITWLPQWVQALRAAHPGLRISVVVDIGEVLAERLKDGELDVAVIAGHARRPLLTSTPLASAAFVFCAAPKLARAIPTLDGTALAGQTLVSLPRGSGVTHILDDWIARIGAQPREILSCSQWGLAAGLVAAGAGVGLLPAGLAEGLARRRKLRLLQSPEPLARLDYSLHFRHGDARPLIAALTASCRDAADFGVPSPFF